MNRICIIIALCLGMAASASAQELYNSSGARTTPRKKKAEPKGFDPQRLVFGGAPVLGFGSGSLALGVAPIVGYRFTDRFLAGIGLNYTFFRQKDAYQLGSSYYDFKAHIYSGSVWARYLVFDNIFAHVEYEHNFTSYTDQRFDPGGSGSVESYWVKYSSPSLLVGAGYRSPISERASLVGMLLYDVLQDKYSPYRGGPSIRVGFNVGF